MPHLASGFQLLSAASLGKTNRYTLDKSLPYLSEVEEYSNGSLAARHDYGDDLVRMNRGSGVYYYIYDGLGSTRQLVNTGGTVTDTWGYSAFGMLASHAGSTVNPFLFNAQQFDGASGNYYLRARYYDQSVGRFISQDPLSGSNEDPVSLHQYLYASVDPVNMIDPSGQDGELVDVAFSMAMSAEVSGALSYGAVRALGGTAGQSLQASIYGAEAGAALAYAATTGKLGITFIAGILGSFTTAAVDILANLGGKTPNAPTIAEDLIEGFRTGSASVAFGFGMNSFEQGLLAGGFTAAQDTVDHLIADYDFKTGQFKDHLGDRFLSQAKITVGDSVAAAIIGMTAGVAASTPFRGKIVREAKKIVEKMSADEISEKVVTIVFAEVQSQFSGLVKYFDVQNEARLNPGE